MIGRYKTGKGTLFDIISEEEVANTSGLEIKLSSNLVKDTNSNLYHRVDKFHWLVDYRGKIEKDKLWLVKENFILDQYGKRSAVINVANTAELRGPTTRSLARLETEYTHSPIIMSNLVSVVTFHEKSNQIDKVFVHIRIDPPYHNGYLELIPA